MKQGKSPSQTAMSASSLNKKALCDYVVNIAEGCRHGCSFCYVPSTPAIFMDPGDKLEDAGIDDPQEEWGEYVLYREDVPENLHKQLDGKDSWKTTEKGQGVVGLSFATDVYMDKRAAEIAIQTAGIIAVGHDKPVRILTRNPKLAADLHGTRLAEFAAGGNLTIGTSIPSIDEEQVGAIETNAPAVQTRLDGLERLADLGIPVYVSMSPTYPTMGAEEIEATLRAILERVDPTVIFHEPINPRAGNIGRSRRTATEAGQDELAQALERLQGNRDLWAEYAIHQFQTVQALAEKAWMDAPVHLWPDEALLEYADAQTAEWLQAWRNRPSPERIGEGPAVGPPYPWKYSSGQASLGDFEEVRG